MQKYPTANTVLFHFLLTKHNARRSRAVSSIQTCVFSIPRDFQTLAIARDLDLNWTLSEGNYTKNKNGYNRGPPIRRFD